MQLSSSSTLSLQSLALQTSSSKSMDASSVHPSENSRLDPPTPPQAQDMLQVDPAAKKQGLTHLIAEAEQMAKQSIG